MIIVLVRSAYRSASLCTPVLVDIIIITDYSIIILTCIPQQLAQSYTHVYDCANCCGIHVTI